MLNRNEILRIERTLAKLQEGDLYDPVETRGFGTYHSIAVRLEALRVAMLKLKDSETDSSLRANKSIASVAHDMKTPLAIISGYAECISDGMDDKDYPALIIQKNRPNERDGYRHGRVVQRRDKKTIRAQNFASGKKLFRQND